MDFFEWAAAADDDVTDDEVIETLLGDPSRRDSLAEYSLDARVAYEHSVLAALASGGDARGGDADFLMLQRGTLRPLAKAFRYTFPPDIRKTHVLRGLLEQANKAVMNTTLAHALRDPDEELTRGSKAALFDAHVKDYVVLLPMRAPEGVAGEDAAAMLDPSRCRCFTHGMIGHLVVMTYVSRDRLVALALEAGQHDLARHAISRGLRGLPGDEHLYRLRMRLEAHAGNTRGLVSSYAELCVYLADLEVEPSPATTALYKELRSQRTSSTVS